MPYTKQELKNVKFYNEFIDTLRNTYISNLIDSVKNLFRTNEGVLQSYEDITRNSELGIGLGIEDATFMNNPDYSTLETELNRTALADIIDVDGNAVYTNFKDLIQNESCSTQFGVLNQTVKNKNTEKLIDRSINELISIEVADPLPDKINNGDTITAKDPLDTRKWLIAGNQKKPFPDLQSFYAYEGDWKKVKSISEEIINSIPEGEPVN
jgi:hypothetical protein